MWSRETAAKEIADHLQLVEHVKALQIAQIELSAALVALNDRVKDVETELRVLKSEVKFEAIKETQIIVNAVQGHLNKSIQDLAVRVATSEMKADPQLPATSHRPDGSRS